MLLIDGVKYKLWTPKDEENEFHPLIKKHYKSIFGEDSLYFDLKPRLKSKSGLDLQDRYIPGHADYQFRLLGFDPLSFSY